MTVLYSLNIYSDGSVIRKNTSNDKLAYVKPDWETYRFNFGNRLVTPDPGIFPVSKVPENWPQTDFCWFGREWQWCQVELLTMQMYGKLFDDLNVSQKQIIINVFLKLTQSDRAYNNKNGTDIKNCYPSVNGQPTIRNEDAKWESLITCGNIVRILEQKKILTGRNVGREFVRLDSFYSYETPPVVTKELLSDPRVHYAKIVNYGNYLTNFHYGEWPVGLPMPVLFLTNGPRWYDLRELRLL